MSISPSNDTLTFTGSDGQRREAMGVFDALSSPATQALAVTPHDVNAIAGTPKALFIGTGGNLVVRGVNDTADITFKNLPAGSVLPFRAQYVRATGTTASDIVALY